MLSLEERAQRASADVQQILDIACGCDDCIRHREGIQSALRALLHDLQQEIEGLDIQEDLDRPGWPLLNRSEVLALIAGLLEAK